jgi:alkaline phosphatase D
MLETRLQARDETRADTPSAVLQRASAYAADETGQTFAADVLAFPELLPEGVDPTDPAELAALGQDREFVVSLALTALLAEAADPDRDMVGEAQIAEFAARVGANDSAWQIVGSQTLMTRMELPVPLLLDPASLDLYAGALGKLAQGLDLTAEEQEALAAPKAPYNLDAWDGYAADREAVLEALGGRPAAIIAGDTHNAWFGQVTDAAGEVDAIEFAGPGVTSPGLEAVFGDLASPQEVALLFSSLIEDLAWANTEDRGYMRVAVTPGEMTTDYVFVDTNLSIDYETVTHTETASADLFA